MILGIIKVDFIFVELKQFFYEFYKKLQFRIYNYIFSRKYFDFSDKIICGTIYP